MKKILATLMVSLSMNVQWQGKYSIHCYARLRYTLQGCVCFLFVFSCSRTIIRYCYIEHFNHVRDCAKWLTYAYILRICICIAEYLMQKCSAYKYFSSFATKIIPALYFFKNVSFFTITFIFMFTNINSNTKRCVKRK